MWSLTFFDFLNSRYSLVSQESNEQNAHNSNGAGSSNNNNNNFGSATTFILNPNSSLPGAYPGNQQNNDQQNQDEDAMDHELHDLD